MKRAIPQKKKNIPESVKTKIHNLSAHKSEVQTELIKYAIERFLFRLGASEWKTSFVLKGGNLLRLWLPDRPRPTKDIDFLSFGEPSAERYKGIFQAIFEMVVEDDGMSFDPSSLRFEPIREGETYKGLRALFTGHLGKSPLRLQADVGFGDVITPHAEEIEFPSFFPSEYPPPVILASTIETYIAEKAHAMDVLGIYNSRFKDFFDLDRLSSKCLFHSPLLVKAIQKTFERRNTDLPRLPLPALTDAFNGEEGWLAFSQRLRLPEERFSLLQERIALFLHPLFEAARSSESGHLWDMVWEPRGPWKPASPVDPSG